MGNWIDIDFKGKENSSGDVKVKCPSCIGQRSNKKDTSLSVNPTKGVGKCHYCGEVFVKAGKEAPENINYEIPPQTWENYTEISDGMVKWFATRGISQITIDDFKIGEKMIYFPQREKKLNAVVFNYFQNGTLIHEHYRSGGKDFTQLKNSNPTLYNIDSINGNDYVIITEGQMDTMSFHEVGYESVVSVPSGANSFGILESYGASLDDKKIYLGTDKDFPGVELEKKIIEFFGQSRCYRMEYPPDCKDPNDVLIKYGKEKLQEVFSTAINVALLGDVIESNTEMNYYLEKYYEGSIRKGMELGIGAKFDHDIRFRDNAFHFIVGKTNIGKSIISFWMMLRLSQRHNVKIIMYSTENTNAFIKGTLVSYYLEENDGKVFKEDRAKWDRAVDFVENHFIFLNNTKGWGLEEILSKAEAIRESYGADFLLIDPINSVPMVKPTPSMTDYSYHVWAGARLLRFAKGVMSVIVNAHAVTNVGRSEIPPKLYDAEMGAVYVNKIDVGIVFHRDINNIDSEIKNTTDIWSVKTRDSRIFGGDITPFEDPHKLKYHVNSFELVTKGMYSDVDKDGNYV